MSRNWNVLLEIGVAEPRAPDAVVLPYGDREARQMIRLQRSRAICEISRICWIGFIRLPCGTSHGRVAV